MAAGDFWTEAELKILKQCLEEGMKPVDVYRRYFEREGRRSRAAVTLQMTRVQFDEPKLKAPVDPVAEAEARLERIRLARAEKRALEDVASERSFRRSLESMISSVVPPMPAPVPFKPSPRNKARKGESLILHLSDWHYGEVVEAEKTRGHNEYNQEIAEQRAKRVFDGFHSIVDKLSAGGWNFNRLVVPINGDMLTGTIHELERHSGGRNIVQSTFECASLLAGFLSPLASEFPRVDAYVTAGNHTRMAPKMESKDPTRTWDAAMGMALGLHLKNHKNVSVTVPNAYTCAIGIEGHTVVQTHGHQIKGGSYGGSPWYGINRMVTNYNALEASRGGKVLAWMFGHFHSSSSIPNVHSEVFINGSLISGTEWTIDTLGKSDRPCQWLLCVHPEHGITSRWPLYAK
jgi:hypothetical protein